MQARFLKDSDYLSIINFDDLDQLTEGDMNNLYVSEKKAIDRMRTKLVQRYDCDYELRVMTEYSASTNYKTGQRVLQALPETIFYIKTFSVWKIKTQYYTGDIVTDSDGYVFTALQDSIDVATTSTSYWDQLVNIPPTNAPTSTLWSSVTAYVVGNHVHDAEGNIYISIQNGTNKPVTDVLYWTPVTVTVNSTYWAEGDNRYSLFIELAMDMALYLLHARINPRNIPDLRIERNKEALDQLDRWASGTDNAEVKELDAEAKEGYSITWQSATDKMNNYFN